MEISEATLTAAMNRQSAALVKIAEVLADPVNSSACSSAIMRQIMAICANGLRWPLPVPGRSNTGFNLERREVMMSGS